MYPRQVIYQDYPWPDDRISVSDPLFVSSNNYRLQSNSPAIDFLGANVEANPYYNKPYETDLSGYPRILNGTVDLGPYEWIECESNNDCTGQICCDFACASGICCSDSDCSSGQVCCGNTCSDGDCCDDDDCPNNTTCCSVTNSLGTSSTCKDCCGQDSECVNGISDPCILKHCQPSLLQQYPGEVFGYSCTSNVELLSGTTCDFGGGTCSAGICVECDANMHCRNAQKDCSIHPTDPEQNVCVNIINWVCSDQACTDAANNPCLLNACSTAGTMCVTGSVIEGTDCSSGSPATCQAYVCTGVECVYPSDCPDDGDDCTVTDCDSVTNTCSYPTRENCLGYPDGTCCYKEYGEWTGTTCINDFCMPYITTQCSVPTEECCYDEDCPTGEYCDVNNSVCVDCLYDGQCPANKPVCKLSNHTCVECLTNSDCSRPTPVCHLTNTCRECNTSAQCPMGQSCALGWCGGNQ